MKSTNNPIALVVTILLTLLFAFACSETIINPHDGDKGSGTNNNNKVKVRKSFSHTVDLTSQDFLKVEGINGSIKVESVSGSNQVSISGEKVVSSDTYQDASSHLKDITIEIDELTNELLVKSSHPKSSDGRSYTVNYTIKIPSHLSVVVNSVNGKLYANLIVPLDGEVDLKLLNGIIDLKIPQNTSASFSSHVFNGTISCENLTLLNRVQTLRSLRGTLGEGRGDISVGTTNGIIHVIGY